MIDYSIVGKRFGRLTVIELDHINAETLRRRVNRGDMSDFALFDKE